MQAGRELDKLIAEKVFGHTVLQDKDGEPYFEDMVLAGNIIGYIPYYSTDIAAAWLVIKKLDEQGYYTQITVYGGDNSGGVMIMPPPGDDGDEWYVHRYSTEVNICLAALEALGITPDTDQQT